MRHIKKITLTQWIFIAMILGVLTGLYLPEFAKETERLGKIFLRLIKSLVAPIIMSTLIIGIAGHSSMKQIGRMGIKSILYFEIVTTLALGIGLLAINITQAGVGTQASASESDMKKSSELLAQKTTPKDHIVEIFPENIAKSISENQVLQIVVFSLIFAFGLGMVSKAHHKQTMLNFMESLAETMFKFTDIVMYLAPFAIFGAMASTIAKSGLDTLYNLIKLVGTLYISLIVFVLGVLLPIALFYKVNIKKFIKHVSEPFFIALGTASSEAALPKVLENMEAMGVSRKVASFVIPTGYSFNLDGTTLYLSLASVFIAQMCGMNLSISEQVTMCLILMITSKGVAGVRGASYVILVSTVGSLGLDPEKATVILGVDAFMDMARTSVNVLGNCLASIVIAKSEGEYDETMG